MTRGTTDKAAIGAASGDDTDTWDARRWRRPLLGVDGSGAKRWSLLFQWQGKRTEMGLGSVSAVSLSEARDAAANARKLVRGGVNPIEERRAKRTTSAAAKHTFGSFSDELVEGLAAGFRNAKHIAQWKMTLREYAAPLRDRGLDEIGTDDVLACLSPIWRTKAETASRVRGRIERVLDAAKARGRRAGENPARWRGHLDALLAKRQKLTRGHHKALPYFELPELIARLRASGSTASLALEWTILAAARTGETIGAKLTEIDRPGRVWVCPPERMKAQREHRVPLTDRMSEILDLLEARRGDSDYIFPGSARSRPMSGMAMTMQLRRLNIDATVHGFRSSFRDWVGEETEFASEIAEAALAHVVGDATERAYRRGDALSRRRLLMEAWATFLDSSTTIAPASPYEDRPASQVDAR